MKSQLAELALSTATKLWRKNISLKIAVMIVALAVMPAIVTPAL